MNNLIGKTLGKYRLVAKLGSGGMAEVYKAYQPGLDRFVAIKVMHEHLSQDPEFVRRFQREALTAGRLMHPNVVQILDFDQTGGIHYMVMQFVNGPSLKDEFRALRQQGRGFSLKVIGRIFLALGSAIDYAHQHHMVHRDLKPGNVMIDENGQVLLTDFGIARLLDGTQYTATGALVGTPAYMSPEQGQGAKVDGRSDIYTLGVILYELVTGKVPFEAPTPVGVLMQHLRQPLPPPRTLNTRLPQPVEDVIIKAMQKSPDDRYQSAGALAQALREAVGLKPGDNLNKNPLKIISPPLQLDNELDPKTGSFTPVGLTQPPETVADEPTLPPQHPQPVAAPAMQTKSPLLLAGLGLVLVVAVATGGFLWLNSAAEPDVPVAQSSATAILTPMQTIEAVTEVDADATVTAAWSAQDDDRDGLTNGEEQALGTAPDQRDTDQDDIDDFEEVNQYKTNPRQEDSDGDSLPDGLEIRQGLNPLSGDTDNDGLLDAGDPDPHQAPTATPLPTATVAATATPSPSPTPEPTAEVDNGPAVAQPAQSYSGPAPLGVFQDFEAGGTWRRGDQPNGEFSISTAQSHSGNYAGQLDYDFGSSGNDFVVFLQSHALADKPTALTAWVYGDGAGHFLNAWIEDSAGQTWAMSFGQVSHTGWQQMTAVLDPGQPWPSGPIDGPDNGAIDYPLRFLALALDDGNDAYQGRGTLYIDDLASQNGPVASIPTPLKAAASADSNADSSAPPSVPSAASADFSVTVGQEFSYAQPWGAPLDGDVCQAVKFNEWDNSIDIYRGLTVELVLENNSTVTIDDDWGGVTYVTGYGERGSLCPFEYFGSGPPPDEVRSVTYFGLIPIGDYVKTIQLNNLNGQSLELCLNRDGSAC
ncbi:MAG: serine/threonine protein kinase [Anaerolineae bacterium]|nr:serine/threonine protein kinase [Anaerolineae bacterium]